jgi:phosphatidylglycerophosphate synthase
MTIRRTTEIEEVTNLYVIHPLAGRLVPWFAQMRLTPNTVTLLGMVFGILAAFAYYRYWDVRFAVTGFILMIAWHVMDGADGQLARFTQSYSYFGKVLDGISDNVTFLAVYTALAIALSHEQGRWMYGLVALSAVCHAIQSASYETQRQEYDLLGWGKRPQEPPPRNKAEPDRDGHPVVRWLFDALHQLYFLGLSFPTARINKKLRATMAAALQQDPEHADIMREHYRKALAPQIRNWSVLSANYRTVGIFVASLLGGPEYYFGFECIGFSAILAVLIRQQGKAHDDLLKPNELLKHATARAPAIGQ